jgi:ammonia channel protein AmtB
LILGGIMGAFMTGLFSQLSWNSGGADGAFYGRPVQLWYQIAAILTAIGIYHLLIKEIYFNFIYILK